MKCSAGDSHSRSRIVYIPANEGWNSWKSVIGPFTLPYGSQKNHRVTQAFIFGSKDIIFERQFIDRSDGKEAQILRWNIMALGLHDRYANSWTASCAGTVQHCTVNYGLYWAWNFKVWSHTLDQLHIAATLSGISWWPKSWDWTMKLDDSMAKKILSDRDETKQKAIAIRETIKFRHYINTV